ncbi:MAG: hypothetical protein NZ693_10110, partial [Thermoflexales bacterium]|nr:hypothetical protein [Thermoflexales bacterium]
LSLVEPYTLVREVPFPARTTALRVLLYEALLPTQPSIAAVPNARGNRCEAQLCLARAGLTYPSPDYDRPGFGLNVIWVGGQGSARPGHLSVRLLHAGETWLDFQLDPGLEGASAQNLNGGGYATFYNVPLWLGLPPLAYQLVLSALDADGRTLQTWAVELSTSEVLKYLRVTQSDSPSLWRGKEIELASVEVPQAIQQGNALPVVLTWKTNRASTPHWLTRLVLLDSQSRERLVAERDMRSTTWPVAQWPAGELVRDQYALPTSELAPGAYQLVLRREREGRLLNEFALAEVRIVEPPLEPVETRFDHPVAAEVGPLTLLGYSVERHNAESSQVTILTFWRVNQPPRVDGRLFVHLLDARGNPVAQDDGAPFNGARTMLSLRASEGIRQAHRLRLPSPLEPGKYRLFAGAYNSVDMERWPVTQGGKPGQHNLVFLGEIALP